MRRGCCPVSGSSSCSSLWPLRYPYHYSAPSLLSGAPHCTAWCSSLYCLMLPTLLPGALHYTTWCSHCTTYVPHCTAWCSPLHCLVLSTLLPDAPHSIVLNSRPSGENLSGVTCNAQCFERSKSQKQICLYLSTWGLTEKRRPLVFRVVQHEKEEKY